MLKGLLQPNFEEIAVLNDELVELDARRKEIEAKKIEAMNHEKISEKSNELFLEIQSASARLYNLLKNNGVIKKWDGEDEWDAITTFLFALAEDLSKSIGNMPDSIVTPDEEQPPVVVVEEMISSTTINEVIDEEQPPVETIITPIAEDSEKISDITGQGREIAFENSVGAGEQENTEIVLGSTENIESTESWVIQEQNLDVPNWMSRSFGQNATTEWVEGYDNVPVIESGSFAPGYTEQTVENSFRGPAPKANSLNELMDITNDWTPGNIETTEASIDEVSNGTKVALGVVASVIWTGMAVATSTASMLS